LTAQDVLRFKGGQVHTASPDQPILEAAQSLARHSLGSLLVVKDDLIVGILSERDILRAMALDFEGLRKLRVSDLMTERVIVGLVDESLDSLMAVMTEKRIRHMPIVSDGKLAGILSIGDIVKAKAQHAEAAVHYLTEYIGGTYPS